MATEQDGGGQQPQQPDTGTSAAGHAGWRLVADRVGCALLAFVITVTAVYNITGGNPPALLYSHWYGDQRRDRTLAKLHTIDTALEDYNRRHHEYPPSLRVLTEREGGLPAYLDQDTIQDEWGREFVYEPDKRCPGDGRPRLVQGRNPDDPASVISNW
jgi:hypothetical protein